MDYEEIGESIGLPIRVPKGQAYRTCAECGGDCDPDLSFGTDELGSRIAFSCPTHGIQSLIDPFESAR